MDFFFVLSGFVITANYKDRIGKKSDILAFALRRFGRVWPLHLVIMVAFLVTIGLARMAGFDNPYTIGASPTTYSLQKFPLVLALTNSFGLYSGGWNLPSWSISAEFASYLLYAVIFASKRRFSLSVIALVAGAALTWLLSREYMNVTAKFGVFRCVFGFGVGVVTYYAYEKLRPMVSNIRSVWIWTTAEAVSIALAILTLLLSVKDSGETLPISFTAPIVFAICVVMFAFELGYIGRFLSLRPFVKLGGLSYSIYMNHWLILILMSVFYYAAANTFGNYSFSSQSMWGGVYLKWYFENGWLYGVNLILFVSVVVAVSSVTFKFIEDPFRKKFSDLARKIAQG